MKKSGNTEIVTSDLRALLHWASVGVHQSKGGSYQHEIETIINSYAKHLKFQLPYQPKFQEEKS